jgi:hypothetical protein
VEHAGLAFNLRDCNAINGKVLEAVGEESLRLREGFELNVFGRNE